MKAKVAVALLTILGCLPPAIGQAQDPAEQKRANPQADAVVKQISSELLRAVQDSNVGNVGSNPLWKAAGLTYDVHMSDCEDRGGLSSITSPKIATIRMVSSISIPKRVLRSTLVDVLRSTPTGNIALHLIQSLPTR